MPTSMPTHTSTVVPDSLATSIPTVMYEHVGYLLVRLGKRSQRAFETAVAPLGLRPPHFDLMAVLDQHGPVSQKQAAQLLGVDSARVVALADELADRGALQRANDPADRRRKLLHLTEDGARLFAQASTEAARVQADLTSALSAEQVAALRRGLQDLLSSAPAPTAG